MNARAVTRLGTLYRLDSAASVRPPGRAEALRYTSVLTPAEALRYTFVLTPGRAEAPRYTFVRTPGRAEALRYTFVLTPGRAEALCYTSVGYLRGEFRVQDPDGYTLMIAQSAADTP